MNAVSRCYVDLAFLRTGRLNETPPGALFLPVGKTGGRFLAGHFNDHSVLVALDGDNAFKLVSPENCPRIAGIVARKLRFEVEPKSAVECQNSGSAPHGSLVLSDLGQMIVGIDLNRAKAVLLSDGVGDTGIDEINAVAFTSWQIVTDEIAPVTLYESKAAPPST